MAKPNLSSEDAICILSDIYGIEASSIEPLPSYDDQNMIVKTGGKPNHVLKAGVSEGNLSEKLSHLELEHEAMKHVFSFTNCPLPSLKIKSHVTNFTSTQKISQNEENIEKKSKTVHLALKENNGDNVNFVRVISFLNGEILAKISPLLSSTHPCFSQLGNMIAKVGYSLYHNYPNNNNIDGSSSASSLSSTQWNPSASHRYLSWDLMNACKVEDYLNEINSKDELRLVKKWLNKFKILFQKKSKDSNSNSDSNEQQSLTKKVKLSNETETENYNNNGGGGGGGGETEQQIQYDKDDELEGFMFDLPEQVIHGDLNDYNVMIQTSSSSSKKIASLSLEEEEDEIIVEEISVIDFGDMVWSKRIFDLAIGLAYFCQQRDSCHEVLNIAIGVIKGYQQTTNEYLHSSQAKNNNHSTSTPPLPFTYSGLSEKEILVLPICVGARLCQSLIMSAHSIKIDPENIEYLSISAAPGWKLLKQWDELHKEGFFAQLANTVSS